MTANSYIFTKIESGLQEGFFGFVGGRVQIMTTLDESIKFTETQGQASCCINKMKREWRKLGL